MNENDRSIVGVVMLAHAMVHTYELSIPILVTVWLDVFSVTEATIGLIVSAGYALYVVQPFSQATVAEYTSAGLRPSRTTTYIWECSASARSGPRWPGTS